MAAYVALIQAQRESLKEQIAYKEKWSKKRWIGEDRLDSWRAKIQWGKNDQWKNKVWGEHRGNLSIVPLQNLVTRRNKKNIYVWFNHFNISISSVQSHDKSCIYGLKHLQLYQYCWVRLEVTLDAWAIEEDSFLYVSVVFKLVFIALNLLHWSNSQPRSSEKTSSLVW